MLCKLRVVLLSVSLFAQAVSAAAVPPTAGPLLVGGFDASESYPWMAQVFLGELRCGGVQIAESWVLTAAHCTYRSYRPDRQIAPEQVTVVLGESQRSSPSHAQAIAVSEVYQHPQYIAPGIKGVQFDYDVSLLRLVDHLQGEFPVVNQSSVNDIIAVGSFMTVIGFGRINSDPNSPIYPSVLQQGNLSLISQQRCANYWGGSRLSTRMFCAYGTDQDACSGDSGGPVFIPQGDAYRLLGLVSWGSITCQGYPGVYSDIGQVCEWLNQNFSLFGDSLIDCEPPTASPSANQGGGGAALGLVLLGLPLLLWRRQINRGIPPR